MHIYPIKYAHQNHLYIQWDILWVHMHINLIKYAHQNHLYIQWDILYAHATSYLIFTLFVIYCSYHIISSGGIFE